MSSPVQAPPNTSDWPFQPPSVSFAAERAALVIVDMQHYDADPEMGLSPAIKAMAPDNGAYYFSRITDVLLPNFAMIVPQVRQAGGRIVYVVTGAKDARGADLLPRVRERRAIMKEKYGFNGIYTIEAPESAVLPQMPRDGDDLVVQKRATSGFTATDLDHILRMLGINTVLLSGVVSNVCVESTGRDASDLGYNCVLMEDLCAAYDAASHDSTVRNFTRFFGRVWTCQGLSTQLAVAAAGRS